MNGYNYSQAGYYFITMCVKDKHELLGKVIVGNAALGVPPYVCNYPYVELSDIGNIVKQHIENINRQNGIVLDKYVVMPNHVHLIIRINNEFKTNDCGAIVTGSGTPKGASPTKATIPKIVNALKGLTSKKFGESMWQRSYHVATLLPRPYNPQ